MPEVLSRSYAFDHCPAKIVTCCGIPATEVRELAARGLHAVRITLERIRELDAVPNVAERSTLWNLGPEYTWFAGYDNGKFRSLSTVFERIERILSGKRLDIICDNSINLWGEADPAIYKLHLGKTWIDAHLAGTDENERIQTIIHEAAHIAGRFVAKEGKWYGESQAQTEAHKHRPGRPRMALRSADNIGYYAMEVAAKWIRGIAG